MSTVHLCPIDVCPSCLLFVDASSFVCEYYIVYSDTTVLEPNEPLLIDLPPGLQLFIFHATLSPRRDGEGGRDGEGEASSLGPMHVRCRVPAQPLPATLCYLDDGPEKVPIFATCRTLYRFQTCHQNVLFSQGNKHFLRGPFSLMSDPIFPLYNT